MKFHRVDTKNLLAHLTVPLCIIVDGTTSICEVLAVGLISKFDGLRLAKMHALNPAYAIHASLDSLSLHIHKSFVSNLKCLKRRQA